MVCCMAGTSSATQTFPLDCKRGCLWRRMTATGFTARSKTVQSGIPIILHGARPLRDRRGRTVQCKSNLDLLLQCQLSGTGVMWRGG